MCHLPVPGERAVSSAGSRRGAERAAPPGAQRSRRQC
jgi:hypothetical protein